MIYNSSRWQVVKPLNYLVPSKNQCASCHATNHTDGQLLPIGPKARHLNRPHPVGGENQLDQWQDNGLLHQPYSHSRPTHRCRMLMPVWLTERRSYRTSIVATVVTPVARRIPQGCYWIIATWGQNRPMQTTYRCGSGSGGRLCSIVLLPAIKSIVRLNTTKPAAMVLEQIEALVHSQGVGLSHGLIVCLESACNYA